jgi:hypothetical protein
VSGLEIFNPSSQVRYKLWESQISAWVHPQYAMRKMEFFLPDDKRCYCPMLGRYAKGLRWKLDNDLHMIPGNVEVF